jgi:hypothetical protein
VPLPGLLLAGCLVGSTALFTASSPAAPGTTPGANRAAEVAALLNDRTQAVDEKTLARSMERAVVIPSPSPSPTPSPTPTEQGPPAPVAGLVQAQMDNAATIVEVGQSMGLSRWALIIGVATAMQESNLYNLANDWVPESLDLPNQGSGADHDSVGLFQQRPSQGWGTPAQVTNVDYAATQFITRAIRANGGQSAGQLAQDVQRSAFPDRYDQVALQAYSLLEKYC